MGGTARTKQLGVLVLGVLVLFPTPAGAKQDKDRIKEWVGDKGDKQEEKEREERRERKLLLRREVRDKQKAKYDSKAKYESKNKYESKYKYKFKYEAKYKYKYKNEAKDKHKGKYKRRDHHHGHGGYGLVYGSHRPHYRPRPRPHPCDFWDRWCGGRPPSFPDHRATYVVHLTGDQVNPPAPGTSAVANLLLVRDFWGNGKQICYRLSVQGPDAGAARTAHVHFGDANQQNGPEIFDLGSVRNREVCRNTNSDDVLSIEQNPGSYYLDVHFGGIIPGLIRGQLVRAYNS